MRQLAELETFAYRIEIIWQVFAVAALLTTGIAFITVSFNTIRTAIKIQLTLYDQNK
ncbi:MAG: hypothetical protein QM669_02140 [Siphonobacter sp.]